MNLKKMTQKFFKQNLENYKHNLLNRKENCAFKPITYQYIWINSTLTAILKQNKVFVINKHQKVAKCWILYFNINTCNTTVA